MYVYMYVNVCRLCIVCVCVCMCMYMYVYVYVYVHYVLYVTRVCFERLLFLQHDILKALNTTLVSKEKNGGNFKNTCCTGERFLGR